MDKQRRKSTHKKAETIFKKAEDREKAGRDHFEAGWQAALELMLLMIEQQILKNPGQLLPMQTSGMMNGIYISMSWQNSICR